MVKAVIFDLDGTLVDTNYLHVEASARAFAAIGKLVPRAAIHKQVGKGADRFLPEFVTDEALARRADELHGDYYAAMQEYGYPLPGAKDLLAALKRRRLALWLGTSAKPKELETAGAVAVYDDCAALLAAGFPEGL